MSEKEITAKKSILDSDNPVIQYVKRNGGIIIGFIILCVVIQFNTPQFMTWSNIISVLRQISSNLYLASTITNLGVIGESLGIGDATTINHDPKPVKKDPVDLCCENDEVSKVTLGAVYKGNEIQKDLNEISENM